MLGLTNTLKKSNEELVGKLAANVEQLQSQHKELKSEVTRAMGTPGGDSDVGMGRSHRRGESFMQRLQRGSPGGGRTSDTGGRSGLDARDQPQGRRLLFDDADGWDDADGPWVDDYTKRADATTKELQHERDQRLRMERENRELKAQQQRDAQRQIEAKAAAMKTMQEEKARMEAALQTKFEAEMAHRRMQMQSEMERKYDAAVSNKAHEIGLSRENLEKLWNEEKKRLDDEAKQKQAHLEETHTRLQQEKVAQENAMAEAKRLKHEAMLEQKRVAEEKEHLKELERQQEARHRQQLLQQEEINKRGLELEMQRKNLDTKLTAGNQEEIQRIEQEKEALKQEAQQRALQAEALARQKDQEATIAKQQALQQKWEKDVTAQEKAKLDEELMKKEKDLEDVQRTADAASDTRRRVKTKTPASAAAKAAPISGPPEPGMQGNPFAQREAPTPMGNENRKRRTAMEDDVLSGEKAPEVLGQSENDASTTRFPRLRSLMKVPDKPTGTTTEYISLTQEDTPRGLYTGYDSNNESQSGMENDMGNITSFMQTQAAELSGPPQDNGLEQLKRQELMILADAIGEATKGSPRKGVTTHAEHVKEKPLLNLPERFIGNYPGNAQIHELKKVNDEVLEEWLLAHELEDLKNANGWVFAVVQGYQQWQTPSSRVQALLKTWGHIWMGRFKKFGMVIALAVILAKHEARWKATFYKYGSKADFAEDSSPLNWQRDFDSYKVNLHV